MMVLLTRMDPEMVLMPRRGVDVRLRQGDATAATEQRLLNGDEVLTERGLCVMHADCVSSFVTLWP